MTSIIDIYNFLHNCGTDCFSDRLLSLIAKADSSNREKIRAGFPEAVALWEQYQNGELDKKLKEMG